MVHKVHSAVHQNNSCQYNLNNLLVYCRAVSIAKNIDIRSIYEHSEHYPNFLNRYNFKYRCQHIHDMVIKQ